MFSSFREWWDDPLGDGNSAWTYFAFVGLILLILFGWSLILRLIADTTEALV